MVGGGTFITFRTFRADFYEVGFLVADLRFAVFLVGALSRLEVVSICNQNFVQAFDN